MYQRQTQAVRAIILKSLVWHTLAAAKKMKEGDISRDGKCSFNFLKKFFSFIESFPIEIGYGRFFSSSPPLLCVLVCKDHFEMFITKIHRVRCLYTNRQLTARFSFEFAFKRETGF